jgi:membrane fusion protein, multidrug efflux system
MDDQGATLRMPAEETGNSRQSVLRLLSLWHVFWIISAAAATAGLAWLLIHQSVPRATTERFGTPGGTPVVAAAVVKGDVAVELKALGTVTPLATVTVKTQINGQLTKIAFQEGQSTKQGDLLALIDSRPYELQLAQAQGQLQRDAALLKNAQLDLARYRTLLKQDSIAKQQVDTQEALVHQDEGTVAADQAQIDSANLNLAYCRITAPVTGRLGLRQVDQGNYVQASDANGIVIITQLQPITVVFTLPQDNLPAVLKQLRAGNVLPVAAYDRSGATKLAEGVLTTVDNEIDTTTGTVKLKAQFNNQDELLFPNQFVNVRVLVDTLHDATVLPAGAVQRGAPGAYVYAIKDDQTVTVRPVRLGPVDGERVAVLSGVEPGTSVVAEGTDRLREGAKVTLPPAASDRPGSANADAARAPNTGGQPPARRERLRAGP